MSGQSVWEMVDVSSTLAICVLSDYLIVGSAIYLSRIYYGRREGSNAICKQLIATRTYIYIKYKSSSLSLSLSSCPFDIKEMSIILLNLPGEI